MRVFYSLLTLATIALIPQVAVAIETPSDYEIPEYVPPEIHYYTGKVTEILKEEYDDDPLLPATERFSQRVEVEVLQGPKQGEHMELLFVPGSTGDAPQNLKAGEKVLLIQTEQLDQEIYYIADRYRLDSALWLVLLFFGLVFLFAGRKGIQSMLGLAFSMGVIFAYILPSIAQGANPFSVVLIGSFLIALLSIYLGHGFNRRTTVAVAATLITLLISIGFSLLAVHWAKLFGLGTEEAFYIQIGELGAINLQGLLLGGIIIGVLGVLDDITTAQTAAVEEIYKANQTLEFPSLVKRGLSVGHEHIISLVNTLILAYVGASFPLLLLFMQGYAPIWVTLNSEIVMEEVVRTLVGSSALVIAVPITTYLAAWFFTTFGITKKEASQPDTHAH